MVAFTVTQNCLLQSTQPFQKPLEYLLIEIAQAIDFITKVLSTQSRRYLVF